MRQKDIVPGQVYAVRIYPRTTHRTEVVIGMFDPNIKRWNGQRVNGDHIWVKSTDVTGPWADYNRAWRAQRAEISRDNAERKRAEKNALAVLQDFLMESGVIENRRHVRETNSLSIGSRPQRRHLRRFWGSDGRYVVVLTEKCIAALYKLKK